MPLNALMCRRGIAVISGLVNVPVVPRNCLMPNFVIASAKMLIAVPIAQMSALYLMLSTAIMRAINTPAAMETTSASSQLPVKKLMQTAVNAPVSMMPSVPMLIMSAASAANRIGVADRIVA